MKRTCNLQQSKLMALPAAQREQLVRWLVQDKLTYDVITRRLREEFGVVSSSAGISRFWQTQCAPALIAKGALVVNIRVTSGETVVAENTLEVTPAPQAGDSHN
jgi:hypothetical protein